MCGIELFAKTATVALPIGIFYTFRIISYVANVYMERVELRKSFVKPALYVLMLPRLIAGPIVHYKDVNDEISAGITRYDDAEAGMRRFIICFFKKYLSLTQRAE